MGPRPGRIIARYGSLSNAVEDLRILLPWLLALARITTEAEIVITLQRLQKDHRVLNIIDLIEANGEAKGTAKGLIQAIHGLVAAGDLPRDRAIARLQHLADQQQITAEQAQQAIQALSA